MRFVLVFLAGLLGASVGWAVVLWVDAAWAERAIAEQFDIVVGLPVSFALAVVSALIAGRRLSRRQPVTKGRVVDAVVGGLGWLVGSASVALIALSRADLSDF